jgi:hypothetical protein
MTRMTGAPSMLKVTTQPALPNHRNARNQPLVRAFRRASFESVDPPQVLRGTPKRRVAPHANLIEPMTRRLVTTQSPRSRKGGGRTPSGLTRQQERAGRCGLRKGPERLQGLLTADAPPALYR